MEAATGAETPEEHDIIIVGSGMAGLYTALGLLRNGGRRPFESVVVLEKYKHLGGRVDTTRITKDGKSWSWEAGAGRISRGHSRLMGLMQRYGLHFKPIGESVRYKQDAATPFEPNIFEAGLPVFFDPVAALPVEDLERHTLRELLTRIHGGKMTDDYLLHFPYRAEVNVMRADMALELFRREMGTQSGFGICAEGLGTLVERMVADIRKKGGEVRENHEVVSVAAGEIEVRIGSPKEGVGRPLKRMRAKHIIFAVEADALRELPGLPVWSGLRYLRMEPLLRVYSVFPEEGGWKEALATRIVTPDPVRYVIPTGGSAVQVSYTDSDDARHWKPTLDEKGEEGLGAAVVARLRELVSPSLPPPLFSKAHYWKHGCTYWLPGRYSPREMSHEALEPFRDKMPGVHFCGESYSLRQGWIEGALEHSEALVRRLRRGRGDSR